MKRYQVLIAIVLGNFQHTHTAINPADAKKILRTHLQQPPPNSAKPGNASTAKPVTQGEVKHYLLQLQSSLLQLQVAKPQKPTPPTQTKTTESQPTRKPIAQPSGKTLLQQIQASGDTKILRPVSQTPSVPSANDSSLTGTLKTALDKRRPALVDEDSDENKEFED